MKRMCCILLVILNATVFSGCANNNLPQEKSSFFDNQSIIGLKKNAKVYTAEEIALDKVPLNEYIKIEGTISKSDSENKKILKNDRFILAQNEHKYQVFNEQDKTLNVGDKIIVYGEYYGFIKAMYIELKN